ncbi:MAG: hypothetical protein WCX63_05555 [Methanoregula sp.]
MHIREYGYFSLTLILAGCLTMGCSSLPFIGQPQDTSIDMTGFTSGNQSDNSPDYTNFDSILADIANIEFPESINMSVNGTPEKEILFIQGDGIDMTGNASSWMVAVRYANTTSLVTYDHNSRNVVSWPAGFSGPAIQTDQIISPGGLIEDNRDLIFKDRITNETLSDKLVLEEGNYTFTRSGQGASRILIFNATTGVLISSHE